MVRVLHLCSLVLQKQQDGSAGEGAAETEKEANKAGEPAGAEQGAPQRERKARPSRRGKGDPTPHPPP
jgi:hypothetical protein